MIKKACQHCGKLFKTYPSEIKLGKGKFCSRRCSSKTNGFQKGNRINLGKCLSNEHKEKIRKANRGGNKTSFKKGNPTWNKGLTRKDDPRIARPWLGKKRSEEDIEKFRKAKVGKKQSLEARINHSLSQRGEKGSNWQGGKSKINTLIRNSIQSRLWRESVFARDNYTCQKKSVMINFIRFMEERIII